MGRDPFTHAVSKMYNPPKCRISPKNYVFFVEQITNVSASCQVVNDHFNAFWPSHLDD